MPDLCLAVMQGDLCPLFFLLMKIAFRPTLMKIVDMMSCLLILICGDNKGLCPSGM